MTRSPHSHRRFAIMVTVTLIALALAPGFSTMAFAKGGPKDPGPPPKEPAPANDELPFAITLDPWNATATVTANTASATEASDEPAPCAPISKTVWYVFVVPAGHEGTMTLTTSGSAFDTALAVFVADVPERGPVDANDLRFVACNDDFGASTLSEASFPVTGSDAVIHVVQVGSHVKGNGKSSGGDLVLTLAFESVSLAPDIMATVDGPAVNGYFTSAPSVTFTCDPGCDIIEAYLGPEGGGPESALGPGDLVTGEGAQTIRYRGARSGQYSEWRVRDVRSDFTPPTLSVSSLPAPSASGWSNDTVTVTFACTDSVSGVTGVTAPQTFASSGSFTYTGVCTDLAGHVSTMTGDVHIDVAAPETVLALDAVPDSGGWFRARPNATLTCTDSESGVAARALTMNFRAPALDDGPVRVSEGVNTLEGRCTDLAGNTRVTTLRTRVDDVPPMLNLRVTGTAGDDGWYASPVEVRTTCRDPAYSGVRAVERVEDTGFVRHKNPFEESREGLHVIVIRCTDNAGNAATADVRYAIDVTPPEVEVTEFDALAVDASIAWQMADDLSTLDSATVYGLDGIDGRGASMSPRCSVDGIKSSTRAVGSCPTMDPALATCYMVEVRDVAGNAGRTYSTEACDILITMVGAA